MRRTNRITTLLVVLAAAVTVAPQPGAAAPAAADPGAGAARPPAGAWSVTLITGDRVDLTERADGRLTTTIQRAPGRAHVTFLTSGRGDDLTVLPSDAVGPVTAGTVDPRLFQVLRLAHDGYDDRRHADLPLIVTGGAAGLRAADTRQVRALSSIGAVAVHQPKASAAGYWRAVTAAHGLVGTHIWLDAQSRIVDEPSNNQMGVPVARQAGLTGAGVPVAVLDTGYDATHPDLAGVVASRDFTGNPAGVRDGHGHGTHVASIVAGAASGPYAGVAPGARLLVGKVCDDNGMCSDSAAIAGMEWAVAQGARVVNMSFGGSASDGTDPLALAVDRLTASAGTLFVAAAGNTPGWRTVGSPAAADAALAVGSVGRTDKVSGFSSAGPRLHDEAVKPDLTAPGEGIVAARAAGTSMGTPVDDRYTAASGTSMATPQVTGVAALLAQQHPDWTADRLKAVLTSTAVPTAGTDVFSQGAGRVDAGRAATAGVYATGGSVSFGELHWPYRDSPPVRRDVAYRNDTAAPVTLTLAVTGTDLAGHPAPAGLFGTGAATLTVPAHGTASAPLTLTPAAADPGTFSGRLTATAPDGTAATTALGVTLDENKPTLTVHLTGRDGQPAAGAGQFVVVGSETGGNVKVPVAGGTGQVALPVGRYYVAAFIRSAADETLVYSPTATLDGDRTVDLDARPGTRVGVRTDHPDARLEQMTVDLLPKAAQGYPLMLDVDPASAVYAVPVAPPAGEITFGVHAELGPPGGSAYTYRLAWATPDRIPMSLAERVRDRDLATVRMRYRAPGVAALASRSSSAFYLPGQALAWGGYVTVPLPGRTVEYFTPGVEWMNGLTQRRADQPQPVDYDGQISDAGVTYPAGKTLDQEWNRAVFGPELQLWTVGSNLVGRWGDEIVASTYLFAPDEPGHTAPPYVEVPYETGSTDLLRDGRVLAHSDHPGVLDAQGVPPDPGRYTLRTTATRNPGWSMLSPRVDTAWTFGSQHVAGAGLAFLPLLTVRASTDLDDYNRAPACGRSVLTLRVQTQKGVPDPAPARAVTLEVSTDDGASWRRVPVLGTGAVRHALVADPRSGYVSLRMAATDAAGDRVEQTEIRAYGVAAASSGPGTAQNVTSG